MEPSRPQVGLIREIWRRVQRFALPEETISLKIVFDNVRNYFICAALVAAIMAIAQRAVASSAGAVHTSAIWPWSLQVIALVLLGGNALQSWLIISRVTQRIGRLPGDIRPTWGKWRRRGLRLLLAVLAAPFVFAAYEVFPALILWAVMGGNNAKAL